jgi:uncharacterized protein YqeY
VDYRTKFNEDLKEAVKSRNELKTATVRLIIAALKDRDINARGLGKTVDDKEIMSMMQTMIKQRQESAETYRKANRPELAEREEGEIVIIKTYLPQQMDDAQIKATIDGLIKELNVSDIKDMGKIMGALKSRYAGQLDMARASGMIKERLSA